MGLAHKLGKLNRISRAKAIILHDGHGGASEVCGSIKLSWSFAGEPRIHDDTFLVVPLYHFDVLFGYESTRALSLKKLAKATLG